ncbi:MAG: type II 3-dehydroquinate dehydratase [Vampirovibrio sp.]|nr:type II 3-dehydroquinate dehydratase [Vampirovibrio sp.]
MSSASQVNQKTVLVIHGPNLNLLGQRDPGQYGHMTLAEINKDLADRATVLGITLDVFQSNHEGAILDRIHQGIHNSHGLIINPGGFTHTSVALRDALDVYSHPAIEVHLSNIFKREPFRHHSYVSSVVTGTICGLGAQGYLLALEAVAQQSQSEK